MRRLLATADVVMHNLRPGKAEKLGIGYEQCAALNPSLIYCYLPGFGSTGPKANLKSFAPLVSGFTGMLYVGAGDGNPPVRRVDGQRGPLQRLPRCVSVLMASSIGTGRARASTSRARTSIRASCCDRAVHGRRRQALVQR